MSKKIKKKRMPRKNKVTLYLNDKEMIALRKFMKKYKFESRNDAVRKALFTYIVEKLSQDYPQLFPENEEVEVSKANDK